MVPLSIRVTRTSDWWRVVLEGELDIATAPTLELELDRLECRPGVVLVDLRGLTFMDLAGVRILLAAHERARRRGGQLAIVRGAPIVERLIRLVGLDSVLDLIDDPAEVHRYVSRTRPHGFVPAGARMIRRSREPRSA